MLFVRQILSLDFKQDCEHCILSLKKQEMTCVTEVHYIVVGRGANNYGGIFAATGTPSLTRVFGTQKNRVKGKQCYRRSILILSKSTF